VLTEQALECVREILVTGPRLRLAVVFGSRARGTVHAGSDLDVGIIPSDPELPLAAELDLQRRLEAACSTPVDLVRLDRASTLVRWAVARDAQLVLADPPSEFPRFQASAALEHADLMTTLGPAAERFRQRLAERGTSL
jgi:predicted nucleotidyltransferase